jgi:tight adherence protein C
MVPLVLFILPCLFIIVMGPAAIGMMEAFGS